MKKRLVYGVGVNDADYVVKPTVNGVRGAQCKIHVVWTAMLERCYSERLQYMYPTYIGCLVCDDWLIFSNFKAWMIQQDYKGNHLDKDILIAGNKVYSPETCVFVSGSINSLLTSRESRLGKYKQGVSLQGRRFRAHCRSGGNSKHLGYYDTENEAAAVYLNFKSAYVREVAETQEPRVKAGLIRHAEVMEAEALELIREG